MTDSSKLEPHEFVRLVIPTYCFVVDINLNIFESFRCIWPRTLRVFVFCKVSSVFFSSMKNTHLSPLHPYSATGLHPIPSLKIPRQWVSAAKEFHVTISPIVLATKVLLEQHWVLTKTLLRGIEPLPVMRKKEVCLFSLCCY